jgi:8-amino-7-oxononanoate synthase
MSSRSHIADTIRAKLEKRKREDNLRKLQIPSNLVDFCSNDYLGFSEKKAHFRPTSQGATGSRLIRGNSNLFEKIEAKISVFHRAEAGLIFNSGYNANIGLFSCIADKGDTIIFDQFIHASIRDGIRLSAARSFSFEHNNTDSLEKKLQQANGNILVAIESIYSMDGDQCDLKKILTLCEKYQAQIILDEAHATGVIGEFGRGLACNLKLENQIFARIHTFGKSMGCHGAIILGSKELREYLINFSRAFIYTTALSEGSLMAIDNAYQELEKAEETIHKLQKNITFFKASISEKLKKYYIPSSSSIQCILIAGNEKARKTESMLQKRGFDIRAICHPTVEKGRERLRICIHSFNSENEIKQCLLNIEEMLS